MRKLLVVLGLILISFTSFSQGWKMKYYVDEFGDYGSEPYVGTTMDGLFSNSATSNSKLGIVMIVNKNNIEFRLYEYGFGNVIADIDCDDTITITFKTSNGKTYTYENSCSSNILNGYNEFIEVLKKETHSIKTYISVVGEYGSRSSYSFNTPVMGFSKTYLSYTNTDWYNENKKDEVIFNVPKKKNLSELEKNILKRDSIKYVNRLEIELKNIDESYNKYIDAFKVMIKLINDGVADNYNIKIDNERYHYTASKDYGSYSFKLERTDYSILNDYYGSMNEGADEIKFTIFESIGTDYIYNFKTKELKIKSITTSLYLISKDFNDSYKEKTYQIKQEDIDSILEEVTL